MIEITDYLWETLYVLKSVYDHDPNASVLRSYGDIVLDGDFIYEIAEDAIFQIFADTREYYDDEKEMTVYVFFDPIITDFWRLCDEYELRFHVQPEDNKYREDMNRALVSALDVPDYSFAARWYTDTKRKTGCRLVMLCDCEFYGFHWLPEALSNAYDAFLCYTKQLKEALGDRKQGEVIELQEQGWREAA